MILEIKNVTKQFEQTKALNNISFGIPSGRIFGLLGPNGAGKTTMIRIITQIFKADTGAVLFNGKEMSLRDTINMGYLPEERGLYTDMKVGEQLTYIARLRGLDKATASQKLNYWFEKFEISDWLDKKVKELSKGMQQKVQFISTVLHDPKLIILDEPFTGLDPINTKLIKSEINQLKAKGSTIIFSTHRMEQVEEICEEIALINRGEIILSGLVSEIKERFKKNHFSILTDKEVDTNNMDVIFVKNTPKNYIVESATADHNRILELFMQQAGVTSYTEILPSLNEIFIDCVQGESDE